MNKDAELFRPEAITVTLNGEDYPLVFDMNAFCELEKLYPSVDYILQMLLGSASPDLELVTYKNEKVEAQDIKIADVPLAVYINKASETKEAKNTDTLNLLWAGCLHNHCTFDQFGEISGYTLSKAKLGSMVTFKNLREVNAKILAAILRDLIPSQEVKNAEAPEVQEQQVQPQLILHK